MGRFGWLCGLVEWKIDIGKELGGEGCFGFFDGR